MSSSQKTKAKKRLSEAEKRDRRIEKLKQLMNDYESLIYSSRDFLEEEENFAYFKSEEDKEKLRLFLDEEMEWLYGHGTKSEYEFMKGKMKVLEKKIDPIKKKKQTREQVPEEIKSAKGKLDDNERIFKKYVRTRDWIPKIQIDEYKQLVTNKREYLDKKLSELDETPLHQKLPFTIGEVRAEVKIVTEKLQFIKRIKKPKEEVESHGELSEKFKDDTASPNIESDEEEPLVSSEEHVTQNIDSVNTKDDVMENLKINMKDPKMRRQIERIRQKDQLKDDLVSGKISFNDLTDDQKEDLGLL